MKIIVLLRAVHAGPHSDQALPTMSPCDSAALETALTLGEKPEVTALCVGSAPDNAVLQLALDTGATRALRIFDPRIKRCTVDTLGALIAMYVRHLSYDLVLAGQHSLDWGSGATGPTVAHYLQVPHLTSVISARIRGEEIEVDQLREDGILSLVMPTPSLIAVAAVPRLHHCDAADQVTSEATIEELGPSDHDLTLPQVHEEPEISLEHTQPLPAVEFLDASSLLAELTKVGLLP